MANSGTNGKLSIINSSIIHSSSLSSGTVLFSSTLTSNTETIPIYHYKQNYCYADLPLITPNLTPFETLIETFRSTNFASFKITSTFFRTFPLDPTPPQTIPPNPTPPQSIPPIPTPFQSLPELPTLNPTFNPYNTIIIITYLQQNINYSNSNSFFNEISSNIIFTFLITIFFGFFTSLLFYIFKNINRK